MTAVSRARLMTMIKDGSKRAELVAKLRAREEDFIGGILLGNNAVNVMATTISTVVFVALFGPELGAVLAGVVMTVIVFLFAEMMPKIIAINNAEPVALLLVRPLSFFIRIFTPITRLAQWFVRNALRLIGFDYTKDRSLLTANDAIRGTIELHHEEGDVEKGDKDMLGSILDLNERTVGEVMVHRTQVYGIDLAQEPAELLKQIIESHHSRIPLWQGDRENIIGVLHVRDLLGLLAEQKVGYTREMIRRLARRPWFVPETTSLADQLAAFRDKRRHFACVVDEYGAWLGVVTLEDVIEEIVGEIDDEYDRVGVANIIPYGDSAYRVEGMVTIRDLNRQLDWELPDEHANTVGGLVMHEARQIPEVGAMFEFHGYRFTINERKANQLTLLTVQKL